jgi:amino acid adenylation domain-containing protein
LIHHRFEAHAAATPSAVAVVCGGESLTYGQLNERANQLGRRLLIEGVKPGDLVAVWAAQSNETVVNLLAVAKAGAAFVPLDPAYPRERIAFILSDAAARILLTPADVAESMPVPGMISIKTPTNCDTKTEDATNLDSLAGDHDLAYVIYTSGSTGQPKGVMVEHAAVINTLDDVNSRFGVGLEDRVLCLSSFAFDLSVYDIFGVLGAGGTVVLPCEREARDPAAWSMLMTRHRVTLWNTVPALMELMVAYSETSHRETLCSLRLVLLSGDCIPVSLPDRIRALSPVTEVVSLGGATEAAIWSVYYRVGRVDPAWSSIPYGRALSQQTIQVLDYCGRPCPAGTRGELYIGGAGLARGYLNRRELTAERFLDEPLKDGGTGRLYRTGDLGQLLSDGNIEILGRVDNQVKVNGCRIELGEIEASLIRHPRIREAAVVAQRDFSGHRRLVAFYVPADGPAPSEHELRDHVAIHLPIYMLPSRFVGRVALPLTANGKIDRQALSIASLPPLNLNREATAPPSAIESEIAQIWRQVLDLETVHREERFVDAGGDSLQMVNFMLRINTTFGINLPIMTPLFDAPTIADLAARVEAVRRSSRQA